MKLDIEATQSIFLRTGQSTVSYSQSGQVHSLNLVNLFATSNNFGRFYTSGVPNFEAVRCVGMELTWYPSTIIPVQGTFEPAAFDLRYIHTCSSDTTLGSGYYGNYNESHYNVLLNQSASPRTMKFDFRNLPYVANENNYSALGGLMNAYTVNANPLLFGGCMVIIQTTPSVNSISAYNPKLGFIELKFNLELYNTIIG